MTQRHKGKRQLMYPAKTMVGTALVMLASGAAAWAASRVEFTNNRLKVDGKPFFFYGCWGTPDKDYAEFKRRHFNTAFMSSGESPTEGPKAAKAGLMVIPYPHAPGWVRSKKMREAMKSIADRDWILAWNIGDDLGTPEHLKAALRTRDEVRAMDPQKRPIMFDSVGRDRADFAKMPDMWCAYGYPLVKPGKGDDGSRPPAAMEQYEDWLREQRLAARPDGFFWTWTQCHVQYWYSIEYLGGKGRPPCRPSRFPDGDHLRLIASHAVSAGVRGFMWFVMWYFQDDYIGRDRYARAAVIGCELDVVGPLIAQGAAGERVKTSDPSVRATPIDFPGGRLICLLKTGDNYQYQPDAAAANDVRIETGVKGRLYQIGPEFKELTRPTCSFDLTGWLLVTDDDALVARLRRRHRQVLPDMATFGAEELEFRLAKVKPVFAKLAQGDDAVREAGKRLAETRQAIVRKQWTGACRSADGGIRTLRAAQHRAWQDAFAASARPGLTVKPVDFYLLPRVAHEVALLKTGVPGPNQLRNGSFESDQGWGKGVKLAHDLKGKLGIVAGAGREDSRALRLVSKSPSMHHGKPVDWVTGNAVSDKIPAKPGQIWEIAAWVRVPNAIRETERGVTITLYAYGPDGKRIAGYGYRLEVGRVEATAGWQHIRRLISLRAPPIAAVAARLSICGVGEAYLDDLTVRRLQPARR